MVYIYFFYLLILTLFKCSAYEIWMHGNEIWAKFILLRKIRSCFLARESYTGGQSGCFAHVLFGNAFWENNCSKFMVSAYSKPLNPWVTAMAFRLVIDSESGKCQASPNLDMLTLWFPYIKRCMTDHHS